MGVLKEVCLLPPLYLFLISLLYCATESITTKSSLVFILLDKNKLYSKVFLFLRHQKLNMAVRMVHDQLHSVLEFRVYSV